MRRIQPTGILLGFVVASSCALASVALAQVNPPMTCSDGKDQTDLSDNFDILDGQRTLLRVDDLIVTAPRISDFQETAFANNAGYTKWQPGFIFVPTEDSKQDGAFSMFPSEVSDVLAGTTIGCCDAGNSPSTQTIAARLFNTPHDHIVQVTGTPTLAGCEFGQCDGQFPGLFFTSVDVEVYEYEAQETPPLKPVTSATVTFPYQDFGIVGQQRFSKTDIIVADFNGDGFDDLFSSFGQTYDGETQQPRDLTAFTFITANDTDNPTAGLRTVEYLVKDEPLATAVHAVADMNGDGFMDVAKPVGECDRGGSCTLRFFTICPGSVPNTICEGASEFGNVVWSPSIPLTTEGGCNKQNPLVDPTCLYLLETGDFVPTLAGTELFIATLQSGILETQLYSIKSDFTSTELSVSAPTYNLGNAQTAKSASGAIDWFGEGDQIVLSWVTVAAPFGDATVEIKLLYYDPSTELIDVAEASFLNDSQGGAALGLALGRFDPPMPSGPADPSDFNLQVALLYSQIGLPAPPNTGSALDRVWTTIAPVLTGTDCMDGAPFCFASSFSNQNITSDFGSALQGFTGNTTPRTAYGQSANLLVAGDIQGRGMRLGTPTITRVRRITPTAVIASPPMHVDRLPIKNFFANTMSSNFNKNNVCDSTTVSEWTDTTTCTIDFSVVDEPGAFFAEYTQTSSDKLVQSTTQHSSWSFGVEDTFEFKQEEGVKVEGVGSLSESEDIKASAGFGASSATDNLNSSYCTQTYTVTNVAKTTDIIGFKEFTQNVYNYPVIGQACSSSSETCTSTGASGPLIYPVAAPSNTSYTNLTEGRTQEWYQPAWFPGNLLSYPPACLQLAVGLTGTSVGASVNTLNTSNFTEVSPGVANTITVNWTEGSTDGQTVDNVDNWNAGLSITSTYDISIEDEGEEDNTEASNQASVNYSGSYGTLDTHSNSFTSNQGVTVSMDADFLDDGGRFGYEFSLNLFGQTPKPPNNQQPEIFDDPFGGLTGQKPIKGTVFAGFLINFPDTTGSFWRSPEGTYSQFIDVGLAHPLRVDAKDDGTATNPPLIYCVSASTSKKYTCVDYAEQPEKGSVPSNIWNSGFYAMRGLFVAPPDPDGSAPQATLNNAIPLGSTTNTLTDGDEAWIQTRVYNFSFTETDALGFDVDHIVVQFYLQPWSSLCQLPLAVPPVEEKTDCNALNQTFAPSTLIDAVELAKLEGFPLDIEDVADCSPTSESQYNWSYVHPSQPWDTTGLGGSAGGAGNYYVFWVNVCPADSEGNAIGELTGHGLASGTKCDTVYAHMTDVPVEPWSNNVGYFPQNFLVLPPSSPTGTNSPEPEPRGPGRLTLESLEVEGHPRAIVDSVDGNLPEGERPEVKPAKIVAMFRAHEKRVKGFSVYFYESDPLDSGSVFESGRLFDHEMMPGMDEGELVQARVLYKPSECGSKKITVRAVHRGLDSPTQSVLVDVPCNEVPRTGTRVAATSLRVGGGASSGRLVLEFDVDASEVDLRNAEVVLEDGLVSHWNEELMLTKEGNALLPLTLTRVGPPRLGSDGLWRWWFDWWRYWKHSRHQATFRGRRDGSDVRATVRKRDGKLRVKLDFKRVHLDHEVFCTQEHVQRLRTAMLFSDGYADPLLLIARGGWQCEDKGRTTVLAADGGS